jgi:hypothetical protein
MNENTAQWKSSISNGQSCIAIPEANFYTMANKPSCDGIDMGSAANFCQANLDGKDILSETAFWSTPEVNGNECVSTAYARYKTPGSCDGPNWWMDANNSVSRGDGDSFPNWQRAVSNRGDGMQRYIACAVKQADDHNSMVHCPGTYNKSTGMCDIKLRCIFAMFCKASLVDASFLPTGGGQIDPIPSECGKKTLSAIQIPYPSLGDTKTCGSVERPLLTSTTEHLAQHVYRALDYSNGEVGGGRRIQIKSDAPAATTTYTSKLAVSNAGLQFGVISPISHTVAAGTLCKPTELGKILQDMSSSTIYSQIQCSYNPTFCSGAGYCYLPIKSTTFDYQFITAKTAYSCPPGTVVDNQQPSDNMVYVTCPAILGWQQIQGVHGEMDGCYTSVTKMRFCQSYLTACSYDQGKKLVPALKKLRCTNSTTEYIVDNYSQ